MRQPLEEITEFGVWFSVLVALWVAADEAGRAGLWDDWFSLSGVTHAVIMMLAVMLIRTISLSGDRFLSFWIAGRQSRSFVRECALLRDRGPETIEQLARAHPRSHIARIVTSGLIHFSQSPSWFSHEQALEAGSSSMRRAIRTARAEQRYGLATLAQIASIAPFIGLFGTVLGILRAFRSTGMAAGEARAMVAAALSEALLTTAMGLLVAVPSVWAYNCFRDWASVLEIEMENASSEMVGYLSRQRKTPRVWKGVEDPGELLALFIPARNKKRVPQWETPSDSQVFFLLPLWLPFLYCIYFLVRGFYEAMQYQ